MDEVENTPVGTPTRKISSVSQRNKRLSSRATRKRSKVTRACDACKSRKKACSGEIPCKFCLRIGSNCTYDVPYHRGALVSPRLSTQQESLNTPTTQPTPPQLDTIRSTTQDTIQAGPVPTNSAPDGLIDSGGQYRGPTSAHSFLARAMRNFHNHPLETQPGLISTEDAHESIFSYGDRHAPRVDPSQLQWPTHSTVNHLIRRYFDFASPTYRILHQGTVEEWVNLIFNDRSGSFPSSETTPAIPPAAEAIILLICAIASLSSSEEPTDQVNIGNLQQYEAYYQMAEQILAKDTGMPYLEFVQARFLSVLYLLGASRMNQAWFNFGPTVQLIMAIGLHRKRMRSSSLSLISHECSKRVLWCSFTLDQYLSLILGRPRLLREEDIDQEYPTLVNDENLDAVQLSSNSLRNCLMDAPVCHAKLSRVLAKASQDLYSIKSFEKEQDIKNVGNLMSKITQWQNELPLLFTENVCPSSLITVFRRQLTVIRLAHYHAIMFVTRPLLLWDCSNEPTNDETNLNGYLQSCVVTARKTLELVLDLAKENQLFHSFWYTQYIAFNALSILYIYIIHSCKGRIPHQWVFPDGSNTAQGGTFVYDQLSLYELAERTQHYLRQVTEKNALAWRYGVVLDALRSESRSLLHHESSGEDYQMITSELDAVQQSALLAQDLSIDRFMVPEQPPVDWEGLQASMTTSLYSGIGNLFPSLGSSEDFSLDFWPQLDRLPICELGKLTTLS